MSRLRESDEILSYALELRDVARPERTQSTWLRVVAWLRRFERDAVPPEFLFEREDELATVDLLVRAGALDRDGDGRVSSALLRAHARRRAEAADRRANARAALEQAQAAAIEAGEPVPTLRQVTSRLNGARGGRPPADGGARRAAGQRELLGPQLASVDGDAITRAKPDGFPEQPASGSSPGSAPPRAIPPSVCLSEEIQTDRQTDAGEARVTRGETQAETQRVSDPVLVARIGRALVAEARLPAASWAANSAAIVEPWLRLGLTEAEILACAGRVAGEQHAAGRAIRSLAFFGKPLEAEAASKGLVLAAAPAPAVAEPEPTTEAGRAWHRARAQLRSQRGETEVRAWLRDVELDRDGDQVTLTTSSAFLRDRLRADWADDLRRAIGAAIPGVRGVSIEARTVPHRAAG